RISRGRVLKHYEIISAIVQFFNQRDEPITELENSIWRRDFGFLVDITEKLIELNLQLRGRYKELAEMISDIKAFVNKPEFWEQNLIDGDTRHFPVLSAKISQSPLEPYDSKCHMVATEPGSAHSAAEVEGGMTFEKIKQTLSSSLLTAQDKGNTDRRDFHAEISVYFIAISSNLRDIS
ncbi:unnamed protein product, partial [Acanthoscelides obtectus]